MNSGLFTSKTPEWATPKDFFDKLNREFSFNLDVCATKENAKSSLQRKMTVYLKTGMVIDVG